MSLFISVIIVICLGVGCAIGYQIGYNKKNINKKSLILVKEDEDENFW